MGFKFLNFNIFRSFQKNEYFLEYDEIVDIFWGVIKILNYFWGSFMCISGLFLRSRFTVGIIIWGGGGGWGGLPDIPDI